MPTEGPRPGRSVAVDSNLLLLLVVGLFRRQLVPQFKRTRAYTVEDFDLLQSVLLQYSELVVSASVLTEVSNLVSHLSPPAREHVRGLMLQLLEKGCSMKRRCRPSRSCESRAIHVLDSLTPARDARGPRCRGAYRRPRPVRPRGEPRMVSTELQSLSFHYMTDGPRAIVSS